MLKFSKLLKLISQPQIFSRTCTKDVQILDTSYVKDLPVYEYQIKSSSETSLYGWGCGIHGALGHYIQKRKKMKSKTDPRFKLFKKPFRMSFGEIKKVKDVAAGFGFSAFVVSSSSGHQVYGTGLNTDSQIGCHDPKSGVPLAVILAPVPINLNFKNPKKTKVVGISAGRAHLIIATDLEGVFSLGNNAYGQCGRNIIENEKYFGSRIVHNIKSMGSEKVVNVECGQDHTLFLTESGKVYACGWGADGQTGLGHYNTEFSPQRVLGDIESEKVVKISSKCDCVLAINDKGDVFGWGNSEYSQIFRSTDRQQQINRPIHLEKCKGFGKIVDVACGGSHCMILNESGDVFTWGLGILGRGPQVSHSWDPEIIPPILLGRNDFLPESKVKSIFCGLNFSGAITNYGHVYTWGKNKDCCLGLGDKNDQFFPLRVYINALGKKLALGVDHSLALCHPF